MHLVIIFPRLLLALTLSQAFLICNDLYCFVFYEHFGGVLLDVPSSEFLWCFVMLTLRVGSSVGGKMIVFSYHVKDILLVCVFTDGIDLGHQAEVLACQVLLYKVTWSSHPPPPLHFLLFPSKLT